MPRYPEINTAEEFIRLRTSTEHADYDRSSWASMPAAVWQELLRDRPEMRVAPGSWGSAAGTLLVGNFGEGRINISASNGRHFAHHVTGPVRGTSTGKPVAEPGLQGLLSGTATTGGSDALWFTDGFLADR